MKFYYGFDTQTKNCVFSASSEVQDTDGVIVIGSDIEYNISTIAYEEDADGNVTIVDRQQSAGELISEAEGKRSSEMMIAGSRISLLTDVVEFGEDPDAEAKLTAWRKYRVELYELDLSVPDAIVWPQRPAD